MFILTFFLTFGEILANFERLVLFCIEANLCNQILILQHFSRSTRFSYFCTIPSSKIQLNFVKHFRNFAVSFSKFHSFFAISVQNALILMKIFRNFQQIVQIRSKYARFSNFLTFRSECCRNFHEKIFEKLEKS